MSELNKAGEAGFLEHAEKNGLMSEAAISASMNINAAFRCKKCGALWRQHFDRAWSLYDANQKPGKCCDNSPEFLSLIEQVAAPTAQPDEPTSEQIEAGLNEWFAIRDQEPHNMSIEMQVARIYRAMSGPAALSEEPTEAMLEAAGNAYMTAHGRPIYAAVKAALAAARTKEAKG